MLPFLPGSDFYRWFFGTAFLLMSAALPATAQETAVLTGTVVDADQGTPLPGANVAVRTEARAAVAGASTDADGTFRIGNLGAGAYVVEVRFVGYDARTLPLTLAAGATRTLDVALSPATQSLETIVVSASRRQEKVLNAPASISVLQPEEIQREVNTSSIEALRATPGVDMAQTGIDRREVVLRGFNEAFNGSTYVLTDYREAAVPSLGVNLHAIMPNMSTDIERVEVVRGPGSALYGPGVDSGVIHYFTKDPFQHPGTTISVAGGSREYFAGQFRNAGTFTDDLGWKITGQYARADEWGLDPTDARDAREIGRYRDYDRQDQVPGSRNVAEVDVDDNGETEFQLRREDLYQKFNVNGLLQYKPDDATTVSLNGGYAELTGVVQSGIGTLQADGFGYAYGQLRLQSGGLFGQVYLNANNSGTDTYVYGSGNRIIDEGLQWNGQLQFDLAPLGTQVVAGADADITVPRTDGRILGRNEGSDRIEAYGGYVQTTSALADQLELTLAGRLDYNNVVETLQLSPRAALVYKATPQNTVRASYNRSFSSPGTNSLFLDIEAQRQTLGRAPSGESLDFVFRGLGAADGFSFQEYNENGTVRFSLPVSGFFNQAVPISGLPYYPMHAAVASQALTEAGEFTTQISQLLSQNNISGPQQSILASLFGYLAQTPSVLSDASVSEATVQLGTPDNSDAGFSPLETPRTIPDIPPLDQTITQTFEVGYKGIISDRVIINVDGYYELKEDFIGPLVVESPLVYLQQQGLTQEGAEALGAAFGSTDDDTVQGLLGQLQATDLSPPDVAGLLGTITGTGLANTPTAVVQPDQQVLPGGGDGTVGGFLSYRNFGTVEYWGLDASVQVQATDQLDAFANVSIVSDDFFDNEELDEEDTSLSLALNAPTFKAADYRFDDLGLSVGASGNYVEGFPVETGPYVGEVDSYFLLDARLGYDFSALPGLRATLTVKNALNNEHREFVGAPALGRLIMGRLTYSL